MEKHHTDIRIGAKARLAILRDRAQAFNKQGHTLPSAASWRDVRGYGFHNDRTYRCDLSPGLCNGKPVWYCHSGPAFEREIFVDESSDARIEHTGWFADPWQWDTIRGIIVRLPHGKYLTGYYVKDSGERVYFPEVYDDERTAVYAADGAAERVAEKEMEYREREEAARELAETVRDSKTRLRECLALRNHKCFSRVRDEVGGLVETIRNCMEELEREYSDIDYSEALEA